jgi:hypothetical protein
VTLTAALVHDVQASDAKLPRDPRGSRGSPFKGLGTGTIPSSINVLVLREPAGIQDDPVDRVSRTEPH